jgi:outer membrane lipoprotein-sorting protein
MNRFVSAFLLFSLIISVSLNAGNPPPMQEYPGYKAVANQAEFKKKFTEVSSNLNALSSDFTQEKHLSALTEKITSKGKLWFKRSDKVRMDYTTPFVYRMVMNGDKMLVRDDQKETQINVKSNKLFQQVNRIMIDCMQGTILESKDFSVRVFENDGNYLLELKPIAKSLKQFFKTIILVADKKDSSAKSIELLEPAGDKTIITLQNKVVNGQVPDEIFAL